MRVLSCFGNSIWTALVTAPGTGYSTRITHLGQHLKLYNYIYMLYIKVLCKLWLNSPTVLCYVYSECIIT